MSSEFKYILFPSEAESLIESLENLDYDSYGTESWYKQHNYLDQINMQAVVSARSGSDEFIKEFILSHQKVRFLIRDLIFSELWHRKIYKRVIKNLPDNQATFPIYVALNHELVIINILETVTYHIDVVDSLCDDAADLCDWCQRALCRLVTATSTDEKKTRLCSLKDLPNSSESNAEELQRQSEILTFEIGMKAVAVTRHLVEHCCAGVSDSAASVGSSTLPLSVARRLLHSHDLLCLLCHLLELAPWSCVGEDGRKRFQWHESGCWIDDSDEKNWVLVTKTEGQVWLSIYQLLFSGLMGAVNYDVVGNGARRQALLRLRAHLTEVRLDVLPVLGELRRALEQFAVSENSATFGRPLPTSSASAAAVAQLCHVEDVPQIYEGLLHKYKGKWDEEAEAFLHRIATSEGSSAAQRAASRWSEALTEDTVEALFGPTKGTTTSSDDGQGFEHPLLRTPRCVVCGADATKRCSRCRQEWYCRRQCQVEHWPRHKKACDMLSSVEAN